MMDHHLDGQAVWRLDDRRRFHGASFLNLRHEQMSPKPH